MRPGLRASGCCDRPGEEPKDAGGAKDHRKGDDDPAFLFFGQFEFKTSSWRHKAVLYTIKTEKITAN
jgi:hypothetical protein